MRVLVVGGVGVGVCVGLGSGDGVCGCVGVLVGVAGLVVSVLVVFVPLLLDFVLEGFYYRAGTFGVFSLELVLDFGCWSCPVGLDRFQGP